MKLRLKLESRKSLLRNNLRCHRRRLTSSRSLKIIAVSQHQMCWTQAFQLAQRRSHRRQWLSYTRRSLKRPFKIRLLRIAPSMLAMQWTLYQLTFLILPIKPLTHQKRVISRSWTQSQLLLTLANLKLTSRQNKSLVKSNLADSTKTRPSTSKPLSKNNTIKQPQ